MCAGAGATGRLATGSASPRPGRAGNCISEHGCSQARRASISDLGLGGLRTPGRRLHVGQGPTTRQRRALRPGRSEGAAAAPASAATRWRDTRARRDKSGIERAQRTTPDSASGRNQQGSWSDDAALDVVDRHCVGIAGDQVGELARRGLQVLGSRFLEHACGALVTRRRLQQGGLRPTSTSRPRIGDRPTTRRPSSAAFSRPGPRRTGGRGGTPAT